MTRRKSFSTAAARRRAEPFIWDIDGTEVHLKPTVDLGELANEIAVMQADGPPGETEVAKAARLVAALRTFLGEFVDPAYVDAWSRVAADLAVADMQEMVADVMTEYTGVDPTRRPSSSDGSSTTGPGSTGGAPPEASTPQLSPPTVE